MEKLDFSCNWNNKLDCRVFTTIRSPDPERFRLDREFEIWNKGEMKGVARIHDLRLTTLKSLPSFTAFLDTGYCLEETQSIFRKMYHLSAGQDKDLILILFVYKSRSA